MAKPKPHLILHKVRGEPAWDVAEPAMIGDEPGWIISTSGHRAYPSRTYPIDELVHIGYYSPPGTGLVETDVSHLPDHYAVNNQHKEPTKPKTLDVDDIFAALKGGSSP